MKKSRLLILPLTAFLSCTGCGNISSSNIDSVEPLRVVEKPNKNQVEARNDLKQFIDKYNDFQSNLTSALISGINNENVAISPLSIYMDLAIAACCTNGNTQKEILDALGISKDNLYSYISSLYTLCSAESYDENNKLAMVEQLSNSVWFDKAIGLKGDTLDNLAKYLFSESYQVDFLNENERANQLIRDYVKRQTRGLIDNDFGLSPSTILALINTLYLKDSWSKYGNDLQEQKETTAFKNNDGTTSNINLLTGYYANGRVHEGSNYYTFYASTAHNFRLNFIIPKDGVNLNEITTPTVFNEVATIKDYQQASEDGKYLYFTRCLFPQFEASFFNDILKDVRNTFDINDLFSYELCDFSNITDAHAFCDAIIHQTKLKVDKVGIEGAAVTIIEAPTASAPDHEEIRNDFVIDRAFAYEVTNKEGVTLFSGTVNKI